MRFYLQPSGSGLRLCSFSRVEGTALMGIHDFGQWKAYAVERFKGVLNLTVKGADKTQSAIADWAKERI